MLMGRSDAYFLVALAIERIIYHDRHSLWLLFNRSVVRIKLCEDSSMKVFFM